MLGLESDFLKGDISYNELLDSLTDDANFINNDELEGYFDNRQYGSESLYLKTSDRLAIR
jgi:hypothetical protein